MQDQLLGKIQNILVEVLALGPNYTPMNESTRLIGSISELDSIAIVNIILAIEEEFGFDVDDDDISAADFATIATLCDYVKRNQL